MPAGNPVGYFEIPVADMGRAVAFYERVFLFELDPQEVDGYRMALFPEQPGKPGATGALAEGDVYVPGKAGPVLYFPVDSIDATLERALSAGAEILYAKKSLGELGFVAEIEDSEGNRIALHEAANPV